jgi:hypothetical protein
MSGSSMGEGGGFRWPADLRERWGVAPAGAEQVHGPAVAERPGNQPGEVLGPDGLSGPANVPASAAGSGTGVAAPGEASTATAVTAETVDPDADAAADAAVEEPGGDRRATTEDALEPDAAAAVEPGTGATASAPVADPAEAGQPADEAAPGDGADPAATAAEDEEAGTHGGPAAETTDGDPSGADEHIEDDGRSDQNVNAGDDTNDEDRSGTDDGGEDGLRDTEASLHDDLTDRPGGDGRSNIFAGLLDLDGDGTPDGPTYGPEHRDTADGAPGAPAALVAPVPVPAAEAASPNPAEPITDVLPVVTDDSTAEDDERPADDESDEHDLEAPPVLPGHASSGASDADAEAGGVLAVPAAAAADLTPEVRGRSRGKLALVVGIAAVAAYGVGYVVNGILTWKSEGHWPTGAGSFMPWQWFSYGGSEVNQPPQTATSTPTPTTPPTTAPPPPVVVDPGPVVDPARAVENVSVGEWGGPQSDPTHAHTYPGTPTWAVVEYAQQHNLTLAEAGAAPGTVDPRSDAFQAALANVMNFNGLTAREATQLADGSSLQMSADILAGTAK